jgi:hypothetical protein
VSWWRCWLQVPDRELPSPHPKGASQQQQHPVYLRRQQQQQQLQQQLPV